MGHPVQDTYKPHFVLYSLGIRLPFLIKNIASKAEEMNGAIFASQ